MNKKSSVVKLPTERLRSYSHDVAPGETYVDIEGVLMDLVCIMKINNKDIEELKANIDFVWESVTVTEDRKRVVH